MPSVELLTLIMLLGNAPLADATLLKIKVIIIIDINGSIKKT